MGAAAILYRRSEGPRISLALAVLLAHALFFAWLFSPGHRFRVGAPEPMMTWLRLDPIPSHPESTPVPSMGRPPALMQVPAPPVLSRLPSLEPSQNPAAAALNPYTSCALPDESRLWTEDQRRCAQRLWDLYKKAPPHEPTEAEKALAQKFERDLKIQTHPLLLPCFSRTGSISMTCLAQSMSQGFQPSTGYVHTDMRDTHRDGMPRPPHLPGMHANKP